MPGFQLILSSDTINQGRIKINNAFSATTGLWSGSTSPQSIIHNNGTGNIAEGQYSVIAGFNNSGYSTSNFIFSTNSSTLDNSEFSTILGGSDNNISTSIRSSIIGGNLNFINRFGDSHILGSNNSSIIDGLKSVIFGGEQNVITSNNLGFSTNSCSILGGRFNNIASDFTGPVGHSSIIGGLNNDISAGNYSTIVGGQDNFVNGNYSTSIGGEDNSLQSNYSSIIGGVDHFVSALGSYSVALGGYSNTVNKLNSIIAGTGSVTRSGYTFVMGYGGAAPSSSNLANNTIAFEFTQGNILYEGTLSNSAADYAEYFEWSDGNLDNEDRVGYFVSLNEDKINIGNSNVIGVISSNPGIEGDAAPMVWSGQFLTDEFGRAEKEKYSVYTIEISEQEGERETETEEGSEIEKEEEKNREIEEVTKNKEIYIDSNNNVYSEQPYTTNITGTLYNGDISNKKFVREEYLNKINPSFDANQTYTPRKDRPEWDAVGLLGKLYVRTAENITGNTISANSNGMAVNGNDYHVLKKTKDYSDDSYGIVQILFK